MANLAATDLTVTVVTTRISETAGRYQNSVKVVFGDSVKTYPTNGIPLSAAALGLPGGVIEALLVEFVSTGLLYTFDPVHNTLRGYSAVGTEFTANSTAPAATTLFAYVIGY